MTNDERLPNAFQRFLVASVLPMPDIDVGIEDSPGHVLRALQAARLQDSLRFPHELPELFHCQGAFHRYPDHLALGPESKHLFGASKEPLVHVEGLSRQLLLPHAVSYLCIHSSIYQHTMHESRMETPAT